jgi:hypothetical protein
MGEVVGEGQRRRKAEFLGRLAARALTELGESKKFQGLLVVVCSTRFTGGKNLRAGDN